MCFHKNGLLRNNCVELGLCSITFYRTHLVLWEILKYIHLKYINVIFSRFSRVGFFWNRVFQGKTVKSKVEKHFSRFNIFSSLPGFSRVFQSFPEFSRVFQGFRGFPGFSRVFQCSGQPV